MYQIKLVNDFNDYTNLKEKWDDLLNEAIFNSFFCSYCWISSWWLSFFSPDDKLTLVLAEYNGKLVSIAPLMIRRIKEYGFSLNVLQFIGVPNADRSDIIVRKGEDAVLPELVEFILKKVHGWDQLHLNEVPAESLFSRWLQENKSMVYVENGSECPYIPLANWSTWDDYYKSLSRNTRKLANRKGNRLQKEGVSRYYNEVHFQHDSQLLQMARELERTSDKAQRIEHLVLVDKQHWNFQKNLLDNQNDHQVLLIGLERKGKLIAYLYGYIYKNKYYAYNTAYATEAQKHSPGLLVFKETIQYCKDHDLREFDFLRGAIQIKKHWAKKTRVQNNVCWLKNKPINWLYALLVFKVRPFIKRYILPLLRRKKH